jgi:hypothetical protein
MAVPPSAKMKLAGKRKNESRTSRVSQHEEHGNVACVVMRAQRPSKVSCAAGEEHGAVACNRKAQGNVGAYQYGHILSSPRVIVVVASSQLVVGHSMPSRERVGDWAGKEEVS